VSGLTRHSTVFWSVLGGVNIIAAGY
jgi:hypothetical protein